MAESSPTQEPAAPANEPASLDINKLDAAQLDAAMEAWTPGQRTAPEPKAEPETKPEPEVKPEEPEALVEEPELDPEPDDKQEAGKSNKPPQYRYRPKDEQEKADAAAIFALTRTGKSLREATEIVYAKAPAKPAAEAAAAPVAPKPEEVRAKLKTAEDALEAALDRADADAYEAARDQVTQLRTALPDADIMASLAAARKTAKQAEKNLDFTAQATAEREAQTWQNALDAKRDNARAAQARETRKHQDAAATQQQTAVAKAQEFYSFAKEGDSLFGEFETFLQEAANSPDYEGVIPDPEHGIKGAANWPVIMADAFAAQKGIARGNTKKATPASAAPASSTKPKPATPGTKATLLTSSGAPSPAEAPDAEAAAKQMLEKALNAKDSKELNAALAGMSFDAPGRGARGF